ncbi:hypothetical protein HK100_012559 [Physocladia obscura]|uniref:Uncharacterized protein n=1 Tax=Physocladia obscura TaxID=109957 RepID=A0AAD5T062_9FUNG|nr:hypothetical protein HK100_012559 [Physocladia obscura]
METQPRPEVPKRRSSIHLLKRPDHKQQQQQQSQQPDSQSPPQQSQQQSEKQQPVKQSEKQQQQQSQQSFPPQPPARSAVRAPRRRPVGNAAIVSENKAYWDLKTDILSAPAVSTSASTAVPTSSDADTDSHSDSQWEDAKIVASKFRWAKKDDRPDPPQSPVDSTLQRNTLANRTVGVTDPAPTEKKKKKKVKFAGDLREDSGKAPRPRTLLAPRVSSQQPQPQPQEQRPYPAASLDSSNNLEPAKRNYAPVTSFNPAYDYQVGLANASAAATDSADTNASGAQPSVIRFGPSDAFIAKAASVKMTKITIPEDASPPDIPEVVTEEVIEAVPTIEEEEWIEEEQISNTTLPGSIESENTRNKRMSMALTSTNSRASRNSVVIRPTNKFSLKVITSAKLKEKLIQQQAQIKTKNKENVALFNTQIKNASSFLKRFMPKNSKKDGADDVMGDYFAFEGEVLNTISLSDISNLSPAAVPPTVEATNGLVATPIIIPTTSPATASQSSSNLSPNLSPNVNITSRALPIFPVSINQPTPRAQPAPSSAPQPPSHVARRPSVSTRVEQPGLPVNNLNQQQQSPVQNARRPSIAVVAQNVQQNPTKPRTTSVYIPSHPRSVSIHASAATVNPFQQQQQQLQQLQQQQQQPQQQQQQQQQQKPQQPIPPPIRVPPPRRQSVAPTAAHKIASSPTTVPLATAYVSPKRDGNPAPDSLDEEFANFQRQMKAMPPDSPTISTSTAAAATTVNNMAPIVLEIQQSPAAVAPVLAIVVENVNPAMTPVQQQDYQAGGVESNTGGAGSGGNGEVKVGGFGIVNWFFGGAKSASAHHPPTGMTTAEDEKAAAKAVLDSAFDAAHAGAATSGAGGIVAAAVAKFEQLENQQQKQQPAIPSRTVSSAVRGMI